MVEILSVDEVVRLANEKFGLYIYEWTTVEIKTRPDEIDRDYTILWEGMEVHFWYKNDPKYLTVTFTSPLSEKSSIASYLTDQYRTLIYAPETIVMAFNAVGKQWNRTLYSMHITRSKLEAIVYLDTDFYTIRVQIVATPSTLRLEFSS